MIAPTLTPLTLMKGETHAVALVAHGSVTIVGGKDYSVYPEKGSIVLARKQPLMLDPQQEQWLQTDVQFHVKPSSEILMRVIVLHPDLKKLDIQLLNPVHTDLEKTHLTEPKKQVHQATGPSPRDVV